MVNPQLPMQPAQPKYTLAQLQELIGLLHHLKGEAPAELRVSQEFFNWYREQVKQVAKNFNIPNKGMSDSTMIFMGVKLVAKVKLK